ncbi:hypothetical protein [Paraclostridium sordellii]|uniref:hypothetical protein n=1 Tax=Paraclostridium sordellii TaxID=1505 RepID=UPI00070AE359|nr:hypothetical protein [Paeniclostridium sordellii]
MKDMPIVANTISINLELDELSQDKLDEYNLKYKERIEFSKSNNYKEEYINELRLELELMKVVHPIHSIQR